MTTGARLALAAALAFGLASGSAACDRPPETAETSHPASARPGGDEPARPADSGHPEEAGAAESGAPGLPDPQPDAAADPDAPGAAPPDGGEPSSGELANRVRWTTASEVDNFGYHVYRGETPDGPWTRITESPIAGAGTTDLTTRYEWTDHTIEPDHEYFYWVEAIAMDGSRERFTPVLRAPPKPAPDSAAGSAAEPAPGG